MHCIPAVLRSAASRHAYVRGERRISYVTAMKKYSMRIQSRKQFHSHLGARSTRRYTRTRSARRLEIRHHVIFKSSLLSTHKDTVRGFPVIPLHIRASQDRQAKTPAKCSPHFAYRQLPTFVPKWDSNINCAFQANTAGAVETGNVSALSNSRIPSPGGGGESEISNRERGR